MKKNILMILFVMFAFTIFCTTAYAQGVEVPENIRIGLFYGSKAVDVLTLSSPGGIEIGTMCEGEFEYIDEVGENEEIVITRSEEDGSVYIDGIGEIGSDYEYPYFISIENKDKCLMNINGKTYRGNVEIRRFSDSDMTVINHLSMQEYLYGVVPREIGGNSPIEAVKAQAVVARTYATKNYGRRDSWGFDLYPTVDDQAYGGYEWENQNSNNAVDETYGQVIVYNGELIGGYYFSTSGGYTESSENVWGGKFDYLKAVPDYYEPEIEGNTSWEVEYTADEVKKKLAAYGIDVGEIIDLEPIEYTESGRVLELRVVGTDGEKILTKATTRTYLGLKSQWYTINDIAPQAVKIVDNELPSKGSEDKLMDDFNNNEYEEDDDYIAIRPNYANDEGRVKVDKEENGNKVEKEEENREENKEMKPLLKKIVESILDNTFASNLLGENIEEIRTEYKAVKNNYTFTFRGRGWGHAVGMSQNGAKGMAEEGFTCEEIITWYYSGVEVVD